MVQSSRSRFWPFPQSKSESDEDQWPQASESIHQSSVQNSSSKKQEKREEAHEIEEWKKARGMHVADVSVLTLLLFHWFFFSSFRLIEFVPSPDCKLRHRVKGRERGKRCASCNYNLCRWVRGITQHSDLTGFITWPVITFFTRIILIMMECVTEQVTPHTSYSFRYRPFWPHG